jgi:hypothetical protein
MTSRENSTLAYMRDPIVLAGAFFEEASYNKKGMETGQITRRWMGSILPSITVVSMVIA